MRKRTMWILVLALALMGCVGAAAEEAQAGADWLTLDESGTVLTVRLPANETTGYQWDFEISDPDVLELVTMEYVQDEVGEGMVGAGGTWVASFKAAGTQAGDAELTLKYSRSWEEGIADARHVTLAVGEGGALKVASATGDGAWARMDGESAVLTIELPANATTGYTWDYQYSDPAALEVLSVEYVPDEAGEGAVGAGGTWVGRFSASGVAAGELRFELHYGRSWEEDVIETRELDLWIVENGEMVIQDMRVTTES